MAEDTQQGITTAVIMAAGRGSRMKEMTDHIPKPLIPVHGRPFCLYIIETLRKAGFTRAIFITGYKQERFEDIKDQIPDDIEVRFVNQFECMGTDKYGTAVAVLAAEQEVSGESFVLLAGDQLYGVEDLKHLRNQNDATNLIGVRESSHPQDYGVIVENDDGVLQEVLEKPENPPSNLVNMSAYRFTPGVFVAFKKVEKSSRGEYEITDALNMLAAQGVAQTFKLQEPLLHISNPDDIHAAHAFVKNEDR